MKGQIGASPVHRVFRERPLSLLIILADLAGYDDLPLINKGVLHAVRLTLTRRKLGLLLWCTA